MRVRRTLLVGTVGLAFTDCVLIVYSLKRFTKSFQVWEADGRSDVARRVNPTRKWRSLTSATLPKKPGLAAFVRGASPISEAEDFLSEGDRKGFVPISFHMKGERFNFTIPVSKQSGLRLPCPESPDERLETRSVEVGLWRYGVCPRTSIASQSGAILDRLTGLPGEQHLWWRRAVRRATIRPFEDQARMVTVPTDREPVFVDVAVMEFTKRAEVRELVRASNDAFFDVVNISPARRAVTSREPARLIPHHDGTTVACRHG